MEHAEGNFDPGSHFLYMSTTSFKLIRAAGSVPSKTKWLDDRVIVA